MILIRTTALIVLYEGAAFFACERRCDTVGGEEWMARVPGGLLSLFVFSLLFYNSSSLLRYSPISAWWNAMTAVLSTFLHSLVLYAVTPNPSGTSLIL